jgi:hypothetical protein
MMGGRCAGRWAHLRELPPLHAVLDSLDGMRLLIVHGYADLDPGGCPGLGAWASAEFGVSVIGAAKTASRTAAHAVPVVLREALSGRRMSWPPGCPAHLAGGPGPPHGRPLPTPSAPLTPLPAATSPDHDTGCGVDLCCGQV